VRIPGWEFIGSHFELELQFLTAPAAYSPSFIHLSGDLYAQRDESPGGPGYVGRLNLGGAGLVLPPASYPATFSETLTMEVDARRLEALEEIRRGKGLNFRFDLHPILVCEPHPLRLPLQQLDFHANQSSWLVILEQLAPVRAGGRHAASIIS